MTNRNWENKYIKKTKETRSLYGATCEFMDKWGALLYIRNSFGKEQHIYDSEKDYLEAIK